MIGMKKIAALLATAIIFLSASPKVEAEIDWDNGLVRATGVGWMPTKTQDSFFRTYARQAAMLDSFRNIVEVLYGEEVEVMDSDKEGAEKFSSWLKNTSTNLRFRQLDVKFLDDDVCQVTTEARLWGEKSFASEVAFAHIKDQAKLDFPAPADAVEISERYTGLIVDCRGLVDDNVKFLMKTLSPSIRSASGLHIYDCTYLGYDKVISRGMIQYRSDPSEQTRAGERPLIVKAIALDDDLFEPIVSDEDADLILNANRVGGFLDEMNVVFIE